MERFRMDNVMMNLFYISYEGFYKFLHVSVKTVLRKCSRINTDKKEINDENTKT